MVMGVYFAWFKYVLVAAVMLSVIGLVYFFYSVKYMVYIKYPDAYIELHGQSKPYLSMDSVNVYGYVEDMVFYIIWLPAGVLALIASKAQHHAYTYANP